MIRGSISANWWKAIADNLVDLSGSLDAHWASPTVVARFGRVLNSKQNLFTILIQCWETFAKQKLILDMNFLLFP